MPLFARQLLAGINVPSTFTSLMKRREKREKRKRKKEKSV